MDKPVSIRIKRLDGSAEHFELYGTRTLPRCLRLPFLANETMQVGVPRASTFAWEVLILRRVIRADHWGPLEAVYG